jgi:hypothetical protein
MRGRDDWWKIAGEVQKIYNMLETKRDLSEEESMRIQRKLRDLMNRLEVVGRREY